jgi:UDP-N-acetylglucosamine--N-acetylmuramyl-(pentapeptide) pyrophosphoryl-undecaprenol N-acetylglucosamine transferase
MNGRFFVYLIEAKPAAEEWPLIQRIVLTGGGTAGHVTPNLALIPRFQKNGWEVHYIGSRDGIERELVADFPGAVYYGISSGRLRRYASLRNLSDPLRVAAGTLQALSIVRRLRPRVIFSKGGFVSVPVVAAGWIARVPVVIHESDLTPGLANRLAVPMARKLCATFPETAAAAGAKGVHTGPPIRPELLRGDRERGLALCGFDGVRPVLLVMGGSLGARAVNEAVDGALPRLTRHFDVVHIRGKGNLNPDTVSAPRYRSYEYVSGELPDLMACADLVLSRAGANAIWEFAALRKPMLLIPLPRTASRGDQIRNAQSFASRGWAAVLPQEEMTGDALLDALLDVRAKTDAFRAALAAAPVNGLDQLERVILEAAGETK